MERPLPSPALSPLSRPAAGFFGPESTSWQLYREPIFLLGGLRALLLQVAHPAVAEGVARFSNFKEDPLGRGYRTFKAMAAIYFGDENQALATARGLNRMHSAIRSNYPEGSPEGLAGRPFAASDPSLQLWVLATLVDTTLLAYEQLPGPLPADWREKFYEESKVAARLFGIPADIYPADLQAFRKYFLEMTSPEGLLGTAPVCREIAQSLVEHRLLPGWLAGPLAAGWLPPFLCERLGIGDVERNQKRFEKMARAVRLAHRVAPAGLRWLPAWHQGHYRVNRAAGRPTGFLQKIYGRIGEQWEVPLGIRC